MSLRQRLIMLSVAALMTLWSSPAEASTPPRPGQGQARLNLNTASLSQLQALPGIGRKRALDIMKLRLQRPFRRPSDLLRVRGIGRRTYIRLKPLVEVRARSKP